MCDVFFFFNDTATTEIYTLSLHDALPISATITRGEDGTWSGRQSDELRRSEEHTSELQSPYVISYAVFCLKKKQPVTLPVLCWHFASAAIGFTSLSLA